MVIGKILAENAWNTQIQIWVLQSKYQFLAYTEIIFLFR